MTGASTADDIPGLVRPTRELAIEVATELFKRNLRVDMQVVAEKLGVARTTLHRWVGGRDRMIGEVIAKLSDGSWEYVEQHGRGEGLERVMRALESFMILAANYQPLRDFAQREPQLALRVQLEHDGAVTAGVRRGLVRSLERHVPDFDVEANHELLDSCIQIGTALQWAPTVIGEQPAIPRAMRLIRVMFESYKSH